MGKALEILSGSATAPGATLTQITMAAGDSNTVRDFQAGKTRLLSAWPTGQTTAGFLQIRSARMHDNVRGINVNSPVTPQLVTILHPFGQPLNPQDTMNILISGSAGAGDLLLASLLVHYEDLPSIDANLISPEDLVSRGKNILTASHSLTLATGPNYTGAVAINATNDLWKANTYYALVGYEVTAACGAITFRGSDTGNLRVGGPGRLTDLLDTRNWFVDISKMFGLPLIPVINSANKANTFVEGHQDENAAATVVTSHWVELEGV
jgi:hypothetical protein